jgi:outer membrane protein, heavy metal efflux system
LSNNHTLIFLCSLLATLAFVGCHSTQGVKTSRVADRLVSETALDSCLSSASRDFNNREDKVVIPSDGVVPASASFRRTTTDVPGVVNEAVDPILNSISQSLKADSPRLNLEQTVALAIANNPTIPQARSLVQQQNGTTVQAGLYPNPQVGYLRSDPDQPGKSRSSGAFLSQEFVTAGKLKLAQLASRHDVTLRAWQVTAQEQRVINDVRIRFYELAAAQETIKIAHELYQSAEDGLRIAQNMKVGSIGTRPDVLQAEMQLSNARGLLKESKLRTEAARQALEAAVGAKIPDCELVGEFDSPMPELEWDSSLERLMQESPLLKSQEAELQAARVEIQLSDSQAIPNINAQMVAQRDSTEKYNSLGTFVSIPAPIFNRNQGNRISSRAFYVQQLREYERLKLAMADQLSTALRQYKSLQFESQRLQLEILPKAVENLELTTAAYEAGRMDFQRVVDARKLLFQTKLARVEAVAELHKTFVEIDGLQLTGALNPTEVGTALQSTASSANGARSVLSQQIQSSTGTANRNLPGALQAGDF